MREKSDGTDTRPVAWISAGSARDEYGRLFPHVRWELPPTSQFSVPSAMVTELQNWRSTLSLTQIRYEHLPDLARQGWLRPLDGWFKPGDLAAYSPQALAMCRVDGRLYAIPEDITPFVFFAHIALLKRLGCAPPRTWEDLERFMVGMAKARLPVRMLAGGAGFRMGFLLSLLGANGVAPASGDILLRRARQAGEAYEWIRRLTLDRRIVPLDALIHPRSAKRSPAGLGIQAGFGWLNKFQGMPASQLRRYVFLPFPRGPSLSADERPWALVMGSCWCLPWSQVPPEIPVGVLRTIHAPATLSAIPDPDMFPYLAIRSRWDDPAVRRGYPLCASAHDLLDGIEPIPYDNQAQVIRLEISFRNALLDGMDGAGWLAVYAGMRDGKAMGGPPPMRTVLQTIDSRLGEVRGVGDVARALGLHPVRLRRLMRLEMREGAGAYFRMRRLELARQLLAKGGLKINEIAARVGYRNATSFCRAFRRRYGHSPGADTAQTT
jgi:AraC-like DNA-binding protein